MAEGKWTLVRSEYRQSEEQDLVSKKVSLVMLEMRNASEERVELEVLVGCSRCVSQKLRKHKDIGGLERTMNGKRILKIA